METKVRIDRRKVNHEQPAPAHLMVSITAPEVAEANRKPIDVVIVIDVSTSMNDPATDDRSGPTKLALAKQALRKFIEHLATGDRVGIVAFSTGVKVVATTRPLDEARREKLIARIAKLGAIAATDLAAGAIQGLELLGECTADGTRTRRVILFTDGLPSHGMIRHADVVRVIGAKLDGRTPITTFGFGASVVSNGQGYGGYDPELLMAIARQSGGNFYHAEGPDGILEAFALELGSLRSVAATNVRIRITPGKAVIREVLNDFTVRTERGDTTIDVGNLYGGETQHVVVAIEIPKVEKAFPRDTLAATIEVTGVEASGNAYTKTENVSFRYVKPSAADAKPDTDVTDQCARLIAAKAVDEAFAKAAAGDYAGAQAVLRAAVGAFAEDTTYTRCVADNLDAIGADVGNARGFARHSGNVKAAGAALRSDRNTGTSYVRRDTGAQVRARAEMFGVAVVHVGAAPQPAPAAAPKPAPNPDKQRRRPW